ncbi:MAG: T9SS type A sorting domain-containing protein [Candidatus Delongbacteria bacterium]|nr:T9SS type A sorting domain-containing protein [Candidatus Delongbacteria bacterium]
MNKLLIVTCLLLNTILFSQIPAGDSLTVKKLKVIFVEGDHYERGLGYGYYAGEQIKDVAINYYLANIFYNNGSLYNYYHNIFMNNFSVEDKYLTEASGIINGMKEAGISIYSDVIGRDLDSTDILFANAYVDMRIFSKKEHNLKFPMSMGCSSLTSYGDATLNDPELLGETVITRHLDWTPDPVLIRNQIMVVHKVDTFDDEQNFVLFGFAGMMGGMSILNESGLCAFHNVGNYESTTSGPPYHPMHLTIRNGVEAVDYNEDNECNPLDVFYAVSVKNRSDSYIIETTSTASSKTGPIAIEVNNELGAVYRDISDNDPDIGTNIITTNHHRKLYDPIYCYRYDNLVDSMANSTEFTIKRNREVLCAASGHSGTIHTIQFIPSLRKFNISIATDTTPGHLTDPIEFNLDELFASSGINQNITNSTGLISAYPNPFNPVIILDIQILIAEEYSLSVYNTKGCIVKEIFKGDLKKGISKFTFDGSKFMSGIYYVVLNGVNSSDIKKIVLIK